MDEPARCATIRLSALRANLAVARRHAAGREIIAVVKADAYGHGAAVVAKTLVAAGAERLAVVTLDEAVALRDAGVAAPILVLGGAEGAEAAGAVFAHALTPVVHHAGHVASLASAARDHPTGKAIGVHVEVDTGMRRLGVASHDAVALLEKIEAEPGLRVEGVYTHFARADEADPAPSLEQLRRFEQVVADARAAGIDPGLLHAGNSAGLLGVPSWDAMPALGATRPGLMLYGVRPAAHLDVALEPVMTLRARVAHVRRVRAGEAVGYAASFRAPRDTRVATLPLGYADGIPVATSGRGEVLIRGRRAAIVGRISMDYTTVDVGDGPVEIGDEAVFFGEAQGGERIGVEEVAAASGTIPYERLVAVGARVPRQYVD